MATQIAERTANAKVETFLPVMVERVVSEKLEEQAAAAAAVSDPAKPQPAIALPAPQQQVALPAPEDSAKPPSSSAA